MDDENQFDDESRFLKVWIAAGIIAAGIIAAIILAGSAGVRANTLLYQNTATNLGYNLNFNNNDLIRQQIWLGTGALPLNLTGFSFEHYSPNASWAGSVTADISFNENNGPLSNGYNAPGTLFFNSGTFSLTPALSYSPSSQAVLAFDTTIALRFLRRGVVHPQLRSGFAPPAQRLDKEQTKTQTQPRRRTNSWTGPEK
jgi:hypothetical protein